MDIYKQLKTGGRSQADILAAIAAKRAGKRQSEQSNQGQGDSEGLPQNSNTSSCMNGENALDEARQAASGSDSSGFHSAQGSFSGSQGYDGGDSDEVTSNSVQDTGAMAQSTTSPAPPAENPAASRSKVEVSVRSPHGSVEDVTKQLADACLLSDAAPEDHGPVFQVAHPPSSLETSKKLNQWPAAMNAESSQEASIQEEEKPILSSLSAVEVKSALDVQPQASFEASNGSSFQNARKSHVNKASTGDLESSAGGSLCSAASSSTPRKKSSQHESDASSSSRNSAATLKAGDSPTNASVVDADEQPPVVLEDWAVGGEFVLPARVASGLYPHQREGIQWLWGLHTENRGGILGDDMGLGKTRQIASFLCGLFSCGLIQKALLVVPTTLLPQWHLEFASVGLQRCSEFSSSISPAKRSSFLSNFNVNGGVMLTTYEMTKDVKGSPIAWDYLVLDEGHLVKNPSTQRFNVLKALDFAHCILLTGTPIQNELKELWALYDLSCEGLLGNYKEFKKMYETPIVAGNEKDAAPRVKRLGNEASKALREKIQPYFLRRMKRDIFPSRRDSKSRTRKIQPGMPPPLPLKTDLVIWLTLTKRQMNVYEAFLQTDIVKNALNQSQSPLAALSVLKKICDHPGLLTESSIETIRDGIEGLDAATAEKVSKEMKKIFNNPRVIYEPAASCKLKFFKAIVENLVEEGHRILVFSQTKQMLDKAEIVLKDLGIGFLRIDGDVRLDIRDQRVQKFQSGDGAPVFLLTSKVGGVGLTLHSADRVVVLDPSWNPSVDNQSVDRAYRIGQQKDVVVYRLISCATVEEKIYGKQVMKDGLVRSATANQKNQLRYFNERDVADLLTMPPEGFSKCHTMEKLTAMHGAEAHVAADLKEHISSLSEFPSVVGVTHHDLLYNKEEDPSFLDVPDQDDVMRIRPVGKYPGPGSTRQPLRQTDSAQHNSSAAKSGILQMAKSGVPFRAPATTYIVKKASQSSLKVGSEDIERTQLKLQHLQLEKSQAGQVEPARRHPNMLEGESRSQLATSSDDVCFLGERKATKP